MLTNIIISKKVLEGMPELQKENWENIKKEIEKKEMKLIVAEDKDGNFCVRLYYESILLIETILEYNQITKNAFGNVYMFKLSNVLKNFFKNMVMI